MSDTSSFLAGCATTGMAALLLVLARVTLDESPPVVQSRAPAPSETEVLAPVPVPPPPQALPDSNDNSDTRDRSDHQLQREIDRQQTLTQRLEDQLEDQTLLIRDLEDKLERQDADRSALLARLEDQQRSLDVITEQQRRLSTLDGASPKDAQTIVVWIGAGFFIAVIGAGGITLIGILMMMSQSSRRAARPAPAPLMYPPPTPPPYRYYEQEFLPPPQLRPSRQVSSYTDGYDV